MGSNVQKHCNYGNWNVPPTYSVHNPITNSMFIDDFTDFMSDIQPWRMNNYILGDFDLHICNAEDQDTQVFKDTLKAMGLVQYVGFSTHKCGNILDLVILEVLSKVDIMRCNPGPFISDHKIVIVKSGLQKEKLNVSEICKRKTAKVVTPNELNEKFVWTV